MRQRAVDFKDTRKDSTVTKNQIHHLAITLPQFKVARTSFLARGMDFQRASRVRNTHDKGATFKTQKTKTNIFFARDLSYTVGCEIR